MTIKDATIHIVNLSKNKRDWYYEEQMLHFILITIQEFIVLVTEDQWQKNYKKIIKKFSSLYWIHHWLGSGLSRKCPQFLPSPFPLCFPTPCFFESWGRNENVPLLYPAVVDITDQHPLNSGPSPCTTSIVHEPIHPRDGLSQQSRVPHGPLGWAA